MRKPRQAGNIVSISSPGAFRVLPNYVVVGASKAALEAPDTLSGGPAGPA